PLSLVQECGVTGPNARASGVAMDVRKDSPYQGYDLLDFTVPVGVEEGKELGDIHDRFLLRLREITQSMEILKQLTDTLPVGEFVNEKITKEYLVPPGEAYVAVESSRGLL